MNHQTKDLLQEAKDLAVNGMAFTTDQTQALVDIIDKIGQAIDKEVKCNKGSYGGGHGF